MKFLEACQFAREGNFVSHHSFDYNQSMHEYNGDLYYEDGANLTASGFINILLNEKWLNNDWFIKYSKEQVNKDNLRDLHETFKGRMLTYGRTYEECITR